MTRARGWIGVLAAWCALGPGLAGTQAATDGVVLVANRNVPASLELARYYAAARDIPSNRLVALDLPENETMSRRQYEQRLRDPLLAFLREQGLADQVRRDPGHVGEHDSGWTTVKSSLRYIVTFLGVPLRIDDTKPELLEKLENLVRHGAQRDEASVDSELCLVLQDAYELRGRVPNPYYTQLRWESQAQSGYPFVMVGRLDGPDPEVVRRMVDGAREAERYGLHGRCYFDLRAPHRDDYSAGDYWFNEALERFRREGYECVVDRADHVFGALYPMDDAAVYLGWYTDQVAGPPAREDFRFRSGAIAYHNHSGNAKSLRTTTEHWAGPLLARGAAATLGAVSEPFLGFTPNIEVFASRLCGGATFAEAAYLSMSALSWQGVVVGDPLYRPFGRTLEDQIAALEQAGRPEVEWAYLRRVNQLVREGRFNVALAYCRDRLRARESRVLREKLADLYGMNELYDDAEIQYRQAIREAESAPVAIRIGLRFALLLRLVKKEADAAKLEQELRARWAGSPYLSLLSQTVPGPAVPP